MVADDPGSFAFSAYDDGGTMVADGFDNQTVGSTYDDDDGGTMVAEQPSAGGRYDGGTMVVDTPYVSTAVGDVTAPDPLQVAHNRIATLERQLAEVAFVGCVDDVNHQCAAAGKPPIRSFVYLFIFDLLLLAF